MAVGSAFFTVSDLRPGRPGGTEAEPIVVWLRGEHDIATDAALCLTLARAIAPDSAGLVLDLSGVEFMGASTLGVIVRARELLRQWSASLTVRSPAAFVRRVISVCGLDDLLYGSPEVAGAVTGEALGSWVAVAATQRSDSEAGPWQPVPGRVPAHPPEERPESPGRERGRAGGDRLTKVAVHGGQPSP